MRLADAAAAIFDFDFEEEDEDEDEVECFGFSGMFDCEVFPSPFAELIDVPFGVARVTCFGDAGAPFSAPLVLVTARVNAAADPTGAITGLAGMIAPSAPKLGI